MLGCTSRAPAFGVQYEPCTDAACPACARARGTTPTTPAPELWLLPALAVVEGWYEVERRLPSYRRGRVAVLVYETRPLSACMEQAETLALAAGMARVERVTLCAREAPCVYNLDEYNAVAR